MKFVLLIFSLILFSKHCIAQKQPQIFQEGVISRGDYESHPAFSPTGDTLYFIKTSYDLKISAICVSYHKSKRWTSPEVVSFSGQYMDADPFVSKDGKTIYFMSDRPLKDGEPAQNNTDIWMVKVTATGWGKPCRLPAPVNSNADEYYPTLADNGNIYFGSTRNEQSQGGSDIYRCRFVDGTYRAAENIGSMINTPGNEYEAFIAPDESYLIFNSTQNTLAHLDFYISYSQQGSWTKAARLRDPLNSDGIEWSPKVTRNGKIFYFSSTRNKSDSVPSKRKNISQLDRRLQSAGNGLADIYTVDFDTLKK